jgi:hypothetical protein
VSFDPQNPRGAPRPVPPPSYVPPQPVSRRPSAPLIAAAVVLVVGVLAVAGILALNLAQPAKSPIPGASGSPTSSASHTPSVATPGASSKSSSSPGSDSPTNGTPTAVPSLPATPGASPGTSEAALLAHIPAAIRATCSTAGGKGAIIVSATCTSADGSISVTYNQYDAVDAMEGDLTNLRLDSGIEPDTGTCEDHATWPAESSYKVEDEPAGRRLCTDQPGSPTIFWTDDRLIILSQAVSQTTDYERLVDFWTNEAGPVL